MVPWPESNRSVNIWNMDVIFEWELNLLTVLLTLFTLSDDAQCSAKRSIATESEA